MKIVFMGTPDYSVPTLQALIDSEHEVLAVYTKPDMPRGRGKVLEFTPIKALALEHQIPVYQPKNFKSEEAVKEFTDLGADIAVVIAYGLLLPKSILSAYPMGCVNLHASLLPKFRGASPIQAAVLAGESVTGVTSMQMDVGLDTGDMLLKAEIPLSCEETAGSLHDKLSQVSAELCLKTLRALAEKTVKAIKQEEEKATYAGKITKDMGEIRWSNSAIEIDRQIRAMTPWPSAYTHFKGKMLKIWNAVPMADLNRKAEIGQIIHVSDSGIEVACGKGSLLVKELQIEGKKRMNVTDFLNGYHLKSGDYLNR